MKMRMDRRTATALLFAVALAAILTILVLTFPSSERREEQQFVAAAPPATTERNAPEPALLKAPPPSEPEFVVKRILDLDGPLRHGGYAWDEAGVPAGPVVVTIDLAAETLSVFRGGYEIGTAAILFGANEKPTPLGLFAISEKDADHVSNLYDAPMPYMLRLTNDGISIHGSEVEWGAATHGCIGVPVKFAKLLFEQVKLGDRVMITRGKMLQPGEQIIAS